MPPPTVLCVTRQLPLRPEQPPDDTTVVVRAGVLSPAATAKAAQEMFDLYSVLGISVLGALDTSVVETCGDPRVSGYGHVRLSTFGRLRHADFAVLATFQRPHFTVVLPDLSEFTLARLTRCFDKPLPNPGAGVRR